MEEKLPQTISDLLIQFATTTKEGQYLLNGYFIGKGLDLTKDKIKLKAEVILTIENAS